MKFRKISVLLDIAGPYRKNFFILLSLTCFNALLEGLNVSLFLPIIAWATDQAGTGPISTFLNQLFTGYSRSEKVTFGIIGLAIVVILKTFIKLFMNWYAITFYSNLRNFWISTLHEGFLKLPMLQFFKSRNGEKLNILGNEANLATQSVSDLVNLIMRLTVVAAYFIVLILTSWITTLWVVAITGFFALLYIKFGKSKIIELARKRHINDSGQSAFLAESLHGIKQIKIYGLYENIRQKRTVFLSTYQILTRKQDFLEKMPVPLGEFILIVFAAIGILWLQSSGETNILTHIPKVGVFVLALKPLLTQVTDAASLKIGFDNRWKSMQVIADQIKFVETDEKNGNVEIKFPLEQGIECRNVSFGYAAEKDPVIRDLSCKFPAKGLVLIKGPSGRGKTTLIDLLQGFYKDYKGNILYDGKELKELDLTLLRQHIGYVTQDHYFFHGTFRENLLSSGKSVPDEKILETCKSASCLDIVLSQPEQLDSMMQEGASNLSGGQKQRLSIARSLLRNPTVLIFDEPTNALDSVSREMIVKTIEKISRDRCVIIVTHDEAAFSHINYQSVFI